MLELVRRERRLHDSWELRALHSILGNAITRKPLDAPREGPSRLPDAGAFCLCAQTTSSTAHSPPPHLHAARLVQRAHLRVVRRRRLLGDAMPTTKDDRGMAEKWGRIIAEAFEPVREDMRFMR